MLILKSENCLFRLRDRKSRGHGYGNDDLLTSLDVKSTAPHNVDF